MLSQTTYRLLVVIFIIAYTTLFSASLSHAQSAKVGGHTPVLQIDPGMSASSINHLAVDDAGKTLVTADTDGTARAWTLPDLRPISVFRQSISAEYEDSGTASWRNGRIVLGHYNYPVRPERPITAVAISPDGKYAAIAVWDAGLVFIYDIQTLRVIRSLPGGDINSLAFSADGEKLILGSSYISSSISKDCPLRIIRISDGSVIKKECVDSIVAFDASVDVVRVSSKGELAVLRRNSIGIYDVDTGRLLRSAPYEGRAMPRMTFSPDGSFIAIARSAHNGAKPLEIRETATLTIRALAEVDDLTSLFPSVAWSPDGQTLYGAGFNRAVSGARTGDTLPLYSWDHAGSGRRHELFVEAFPPRELTGLPDGRLVWLAQSAQGGGIVISGPSGTDQQRRRNDNMDFWPAYTVGAADPRRRFSASIDGNSVEWVLQEDEGKYFRFSLRDLDLTIGRSPSPGLANWTDQRPGIRIDDYSTPHAAVRLNGNLFLNPNPDHADAYFDPYPGEHAVAVSSKTILLGNPGLRLFDSRGKQLWWHGVPFLPFVVRTNLSEDGRLAIAAFEDGTIRWFRVSDGRPLLTLFVTRNADRWVLWTPSGYYAASPGGEDLFGWNLNRRPDQAADFYHAGRFRDWLYRPDVVRRVLADLDEDTALHDADAVGGEEGSAARPITADLPPVITITSPREGTRLGETSAQIDYTLRSPSGRPVREIRVLVDGRPAPVKVVVPPLPPGNPEAEVTGSITVPIAGGRQSAISILASSDSGRYSDPSRIQIWGGSSSAPAPERSRLFALVIGVGQFAALGIPQLPFSENDALEFARALNSPSQARLYSVQTRVLTDRAATTKQSVLNGLAWLKANANRPDDVALIYIASHGESDIHSFWVLVSDTRFLTRKATSVSGEDLITSLVNIPGRVVILLDTCHAAAVNSAFPDMTQFANLAGAAENGLFVYASSVRDRSAREDELRKHGIFTAALLEAASGQGGVAVHEGIVDTDALDSFLRLRVLSLSREARVPEQLPILVRPAEAPDFPLFAVR